MSIPPGDGAIEFARHLIEGLDRSAAISMLGDLLALNDAALMEAHDPRVKRCLICHYPFRDRTRPGNAKVCGAPCTTAKKTTQKQIQRKRNDQPIRKLVPYVWWIEYPYWTSERAMLSRVWSYERPSEKIAEIHAAKIRYEQRGCRGNGGTT